MTEAPTPNEHQYPTIVIQFKSANGNLPPDMDLTPAELAMFLGQGIAQITTQTHTNADISYGFSSVEDTDSLRETLEKA